MDELWIGFMVGMIYQLTGIPAWQARQVERGWAAWQEHRRKQQKQRYELLEAGKP